MSITAPTLWTCLFQLWFSNCVCECVRDNLVCFKRDQRKKNRPSRHWLISAADKKSLRVCVFVFLNYYKWVLIGEYKLEWPEQDWTSSELSADECGGVVGTGADLPPRCLLSGLGAFSGTLELNHQLLNMLTKRPRFLFCTPEECVLIHGTVRLLSALYTLVLKEWGDENVQGLLCRFANCYLTCFSFTVHIHSL